jgi:non-heme chloroperoxidase
LKFVEGEPGVQIHVLDQGTSHPIVLLPGWPFSNEVFKPLLTPLTAKGYRVIVPSPRGFGMSDKVAEDYNYDFQADDLSGVLEQLDLNRVVLFGHSMGAAVAIRYMSRHHGARVSKLVLCDAAAPFWPRRSGFASGLSLPAADYLIEHLETEKNSVFRGVLEAFRSNAVSLSPMQNNWLHGLAMQASPHVLTQTLVEMRNSDLRPDLESINVPTAIFHGVSDKFCPFQFATELSKAIKHSQVVRFEKSGHLPFLEEEEKFKTELLKFAISNG